MLSLNDLVRWRAERHPDLVALVDDRDDRTTYAQLHDRILDQAMLWLERGIGAGDVVAIVDTNSIAKLVSVFGLSRIGAIPALMNFRLAPVEHAELFERMGVVAVAAGPALIERLPAELPERRVVLGPATGDWNSYDDTADTKERRELPPPPRPSDVFALAFSSGTTGRAKGIPWRHSALARSTMLDAIGVAGMQQGSRQLLVAPTFHLAGFANLLMGLSRGAEIHLRTAFDPGRVLADIEIKADDQFYGYAEKYEKQTTEYIVNPGLPDETRRQMHQQAVQAVRDLGCEGATRADFFVADDGTVTFMEINTIPGMTETSLLPQIAAAAGIPFDELVERIAWDARVKC